MIKRPLRWFSDLPGKGSNIGAPAPGFQEMPEHWIRGNAKSVSAFRNMQRVAGVPQRKATMNSSLELEHASGPIVRGSHTSRNADDKNQCIGKSVSSAI